MADIRRLSVTADPIVGPENMRHCRLHWQRAWCHQHLLLPGPRGTRLHSVTSQLPTLTFARLPFCKWHPSLAPGPLPPGLVFQQDPWSHTPGAHVHYKAEQLTASTNTCSLAGPGNDEHNWKKNIMWRPRFYTDNNTIASI